MKQGDPRIDAYIANAAPFARPILTELRARVHEACPEVEETMKWSAPSFVYAGAILAGMAAFKQHVSFGFWKHALVMGEDAPRDGMGSFGRLSSLRDLPSRRNLATWIRKAMRVNEEGVTTTGPRKTTSPKPPPKAPPDLAAALARNRKARATFEAFPPSQQREYVDWISEAKRNETRERRLAQALEWLAQGKPRNWKYMKC